MKAIKTCVIFAFLFLGLPCLSAQNIKDQLDAVYGLSPILYNGKIYSDFYNKDVKGDPFLKSKSYSNGELRLRQGYFNGLDLNYDIYQQKVILQFASQNKAIRQIEVPLEHLIEFKIEEGLFQIFQQEDQSYKIYHIIGAKSTKIYLFWYKNLETIQASSSYKHEFTEAKREFHLLKEEQLIPINNNKNLRHCYPKKLQADIKKWMKTHGIKLQKANDGQLLELCQYLDSL